MKCKKLSRVLMVKAADDCANCGGTGLRVQNEYDRTFYRLEVNIDVCPCVKVVGVEESVA